MLTALSVEHSRPRLLGTALSLMLIMLLSLSLCTSPLNAQQTTLVKTLIDNLRTTQDEYTRQAIASELREIGAPAAPAVGPLIETLRATQSEATRKAIANALAGI